MAEILKIVLTGGPCAGKTSALLYLKKELEKENIEVKIIEETATKLMISGKTPENMGNYNFHKLLFETQLQEEKKIFSQAEKSSSEKVVILLDRGLLDNAVYVEKEDFEKYSSINGLCEDYIRNSYDAVFHLVTSANGAEKFYNFENNTIRSENIEKARQIDESLLAIWTGTPHLRVIDNSTPFEEKLKRLLKEVKCFIGVPEPFEIERKFLIEYPNINFLNNLKTCRKTPITQAYLNTPDEGIFRIRKRGNKNSEVYIKTIKIKINDIKRIEKEYYITKQEFENYISNKEYVTGIISKDRYCIVYNSTYYELDVYPFWNDRATLEIELCNEDEKYTLPPFVKLIREVSFEPEYRNFALAQKFQSSCI